MPYLGLHFSVKPKRFSIKVAEDNYMPTVLVVFLLSFVMPQVSSIPLAGIWLGTKMQAASEFEIGMTLRIRSLARQTIGAFS